ncbi:MAG: hypothetical protein KGZ43_11290, partial [Sulfuritalea sp.]|nr:hypothetical protein [Sulfuritalea sp.]
PHFRTPPRKTPPLPQGRGGRTWQNARGSGETGCAEPRVVTQNIVTLIGEIHKNNSLFLIVMISILLLPCSIPCQYPPKPTAPSGDHAEGIVSDGFAL